LLKSRQLVQIAFFVMVITSCKQCLRYSSARARLLRANAAHKGGDHAHHSLGDSTVFSLGMPLQLSTLHVSGSRSVYLPVQPLLLSSLANPGRTPALGAGWRCSRLVYHRMSRFSRRMRATKFLFYRMILPKGPRLFETRQGLIFALRGRLVLPRCLPT
jgi:hypothetical protein